MSEESIVTILVALIGSALLPTVINKIKPKAELDSVNIENALKLMEKHELKYNQLETRFDRLEKKYDAVVEENERLEDENNELKRENRQYQSEIENLKSRVQALEKEIERTKQNEVK